MHARLEASTAALVVLLNADVHMYTCARGPRQLIPTTLPLPNLRTNATWSHSASSTVLMCALCSMWEAQRERSQRPCTNATATASSS